MFLCHKNRVFVIYTSIRMVYLSTQPEQILITMIFEYKNPISCFSEKKFYSKKQKTIQWLKLLY